MSVFPMPSPNNTNYAKLYCVTGRGPALALDASLRVACDVDDAIENLKQFLRARLGDDDFRTLEGLVAKIGDNGGGGERRDGNQTGHEDPQPVEDDDLPQAELAQAGMPLGRKYGAAQARAGERVPGGEGLPSEKLASDSRRAKGYADCWPDATKAAASGGSFLRRSYSDD